MVYITMELVTLRYFVTVARELHFRRAAEKLHMTQAPLSVAIRKLEDELETELFERSSRSVRLTPAGEFFLAEAEAVLKRAEVAQMRLKRMLSGSSGHLRIGYNEPALNTVLPDMLANFRQVMPEVKLELRELEPAGQISGLQEGTLDIGFMRPYGFKLDGLAFKLVHREEYDLVMPDEHPLARESTITVEKLSGREIILFARDVNPGLFDLLCGRLSALNLPPPEFRQDARNKSSMLAMVKAGFGAALLPESSLSGGGVPGLTVRKLDIELPPIDIMAVWHPERITPAAELFLKSAGK